jgi:hypothetical protein
MVPNSISTMHPLTRMKISELLCTFLRLYDASSILSVRGLSSSSPHVEERERGGGGGRERRGELVYPLTDVLST